MAKTAQLEKTVQRLIEQYTLTIKEALAGGEEAPALPTEEHVNGFLQELNHELEQRIAARTADLQRTQASLQSLIHTTQDAVISIDQHGCILLFNPAAERMFSYTQAEVIGQKVNILMAEPYAREHDSYIAHYERTGEAHAIGRIRSVTAKRKDGERFPIELSVTEARTESEVRDSAFIRDISEKIKLQERLLERERLAAIGTTAATFAHEVGNPLNGMSLTAQILERRLAKRPEQAIDPPCAVALSPSHAWVSRMLISHSTS